MAIQIQGKNADISVVGSGGMAGGIVMAFDFIKGIVESFFSKPEVASDGISWDRLNRMCFSKFRFSFETGHFWVGFRRYRFSDIASFSRTGSVVELKRQSNKKLLVPVESERNADRVISFFQANERGIVYRRPKN
jgi:hypothetical protein